MAVALLALAACGDTGDSSEAATEASTPVTADSAVASTEPATTEMATTESSAPAESMRGLRYCEILLLAPANGGIRATVFNTYPLNDCPDDAWRALDPPSIAAAEGAVFALANGPRYWLMDSVGRDSGDVIRKTFGSLQMNRYATVDITDPRSIGVRYATQKVDRKATFMFRAGSTVYELVADDGRRFVMQSWSQQVDPNLSEEDLAGLGARLTLPAGWTYEAVPLTDDLVVGADRAVAEVLQDELLNSYSLIG